MAPYQNLTDAVKSMKTVSAQEARERITSFYRGRGILLEEGMNKIRYAALGLESLRAVAAVAVWLGHGGTGGDKRTLVSHDYGNKLLAVGLKFDMAYPTAPANLEYVPEGKEWFAFAFRRDPTSDREKLCSDYAKKFAFGEPKSMTHLAVHSFHTYKEYLQLEILDLLEMGSDLPESSAALEFALTIPKGQSNGAKMEFFGREMIRLFEASGHDIDKADHARLSSLYASAGKLLSMKLSLDRI